jgi:hypothetical protein
MGLFNFLGSAAKDNSAAGVAEGAVTGLVGGLGKLAKDIREAITGEAILDPNKRAELLLKAQELEAASAQAQMAIVLAESQSQDKWTSRGRPMFLYVMYIMLLFGIPMGLVAAFWPDKALAIAAGYQAWLKAIPSDLYALFGAGYLGYGVFRSVDKAKGGK